MHGVEGLLETLQIQYMVDYAQLDDGRFLKVEARISDPMKYAKDIFMLNHIINPKLLTTLSVQEAFMVSSR